MTDNDVRTIKNNELLISHKELWVDVNPLRNITWGDGRGKKTFLHVGMAGTGTQPCLAPLLQALQLHHRPLGKPPVWLTISFNEAVPAESSAWHYLQPEFSLLDHSAVVLPRCCMSDADGKHPEVWDRQSMYSSAGSYGGLKPLLTVIFLAIPCLG